MFVVDGDAHEPQTYYSFKDNQVHFIGWLLTEIQLAY
jgi:hypothetical protein